MSAWRELDHQTRRRLLAAGEPAGDPMVAVVAVGYARTMLTRSRSRRLKLLLPLMACAVAFMVAADLIYGKSVLATPLGALLYFAVIFAGLLLGRLWTLRQTVRLLRMETVNASRLWRTEAPAPAAAVLPLPPGTGPVAFRFSPRKLLRLYGTVAVVFALTQLIWMVPGEAGMAAVLTVLVLAGVCRIGYLLVRRMRPWQAPIVLDEAGITFVAQGARAAWTEITQIRVSPVRAGNRRTAQRQVVAFLVTDPNAAVARFQPFAQRAARRSLEAYGTPMTVTDLFLDTTCEDILATAARFTTAPIRRFN